MSSKHHSISRANVKFDGVLQRTDEATFHGDRAGIFGQSVAQTDEEYWVSPTFSGAFTDRIIIANSKCYVSPFLIDGSVAKSRVSLGGP